jgi:branched-chain amino acid transport system substrate-binding protein
VFSAIGDSITEQGFDYTFRPHAPAREWATQQFNFLDWLNVNKTDELGEKIEQVAFLYENTEYGQSTAENWRRLSEEHGYEVVSDLAYPHGASNMTSTINRLRSADPDAVLLVSYVSDALMIARTEEQLGYKPPIQIGTGGGHSDVAFLKSGPGAEGVYTIANWNADIAKEFNETFVDSYTRRWGAEPTSHAAQGMMNVYILKEVLEDSGSANPEDIRKALENYKSTNVPPAISGADVVEFDEKGQNPHTEVILTQIQNGEYRTVFPRGAASTEPVLPEIQE